VAAIGFGVYGLAHTPDPTPAAPTRTDRPAPTALATSQPSGPAATTDPERFARWAASALFDWDTATMDPADVTAKLMAAVDPSGEGEGAGLASDVANYLPDQATWARLRGHGTRQWIEIESVEVPDAWGEAVAGAAPGQILPGTTAHTVTATRHREGVWEGEPTSYEGRVAFTVFITCQPSFPECRLMRLSLPDQPLR
jgi:hypothetical protein